MNENGQTWFIILVDDGRGRIRARKAQWCDRSWIDPVAIEFGVPRH
ncbi:hypothetical protein [Halotia branconii]|uniref:Uncharacterized protein n=1 Tax=Halotia branconii CENA392 TaxID=1539056 RepID=A0AAJ6NYM0_9CYAN|nr:hypothetical protein [Halotia branconii]WGV28985.1 hypothetical protein QI031_12065 [Halotia branconii CENA392]